MRLKSPFVKFLLICVFCMAWPSFSFSQIGVDTTQKIIQFSGIAVDADSLTPLPFVAIVVRNSERGVYSNINGYYSIVVQPKDTVDFFALGYHRGTFIIADTFRTNSYTHVQALKIDTII